MKNYLSMLSIILIAMSCNFSPKPLDIEIDEPTQKLVVSSFLIAPQESAVTLTRSFTALVNDDSLNLQDSANQFLLDRLLVNSGSVWIEHGGVNQELSQLAPSIFVSLDLAHNFGETYRLYAKDNLTGEEIRAETQLLPQVEIDTLLPVYEIVKALDDTIYSIEVHVYDPPGVTNYYLVTATRLRSYQSDTSNLGGALTSQSQNNFSVFSDLQYGDGNLIKFTPPPFANRGDTLVVGLSNITKGYFEFLSAYKRSGNLLSQLAGEPINLPTNVENGYGYFAMIRPKLGLVIMQ